MNITTAAQKVKKIMKDNCFRREVLASSGKVNFNRLPFYQSSKLLFSRPSERQGKKYYVELLLDCSGSMSGSKYELASQACEMIAKTLGKNCDLKITLFNYLEKIVKWQDFTVSKYGTLFDGSVFPEYIEVQEGDKKIIVPEPQRIRYKKTQIISESSSTAGNWEACNILNAAARLRKKQGNRLILVLLDGQPNLDYHYTKSKQKNLYVAGRRVDKLPRDNYRKEMEKLGKEGINIEAFGLHTRAPELYFPNFTQINDVEEILPSLIKTIQKHVKK